MKAYRYLLLILVLVTYTCGGSGGGGGSSSLPTSEGGGGTPGGNTSNTTTPATISLVAVPTGLSFGEESIITATVLNSAGDPVPDGTTVNFILSSSSLGTLSAASEQTALGIAAVTFTAGASAGTVVVTGSAGSISDDTSVVISLVSQINLTANPATLTVLATSTVTATIRDGLGNLVPDGTPVTFSISPTTLGSITASSNTVNGDATATFTAGNTAGTVVVTATSGTNNTVNITIIPADTSSIEFSTALPANIGIWGSGQQVISTVTFIVKDVNGNTVNDVSVDLCLTGPAGGRLPAAGGEYIGAVENSIEVFTDSNGNGCFDSGETYADTNLDGKYTSPLHDAVSTSNGGKAVVNVTSGTVAGNVTIIATVQNTSPRVSTSSSVLSIGGGTASLTHFTTGSNILNLPGLLSAGGFANELATLTTLVADRFGNANLLQNTTVSYYTECGATVTSSSKLDSKGETTVVYRTQDPDPADVEPIGGSSCSGTPSSLSAVFTTYDAEWESCLQKYVDVTYLGSTPSGHPRDGWCTVTASVIGEEHFDDLDGDGIYNGPSDPGTDDDFEDSPQEPFIDFNDNETYDVFNVPPGSQPDPTEVFIDKDGDSTFDGGNGVWDNAKPIFVNRTLLITGPPHYIEFSSGGTPAASFNIANASFQNFKVLISDVNLNYLSSGTTVKITLEGDGSKVTGFLDYKFPNVFAEGPIELGFTVSDTDTEATSDPNIATVKVTVTWEGADYVGFITGTVN